MDLITLALSKNYTNKAVQEAQLAPTAFKVVDMLPSVGETGFIYLVPKEDGKDKNIYTEYIWAENAFEKIGDTEINLQDYATIEYVDNQKEIEVFTVDFTQTNAATYQPIVDAVHAGKAVEIRWTGGRHNVFHLTTLYDNNMQFQELDLNTSTEDAGYSRTRNEYISIWFNQETKQITSVDNFVRILDYISPIENYDNPYTPQYDGSPATKKYVDDSISSAITAAIEGAY